LRTRKFSNSGYEEGFERGGEALLMDVMQAVLSSYPKKLAFKSPDVSACSSVPIHDLLAAHSREELIKELICAQVPT
jgi:hypothetical protein